MRFKSGLQQTGAFLLHFAGLFSPSLNVPALIIDLCPSIQISRWWTLSSGWFTNSKAWCSSLLCPSIKVMLILLSPHYLHMHSPLFLGWVLSSHLVYLPAAFLRQCSQQHKCWSTCAALGGKLKFHSYLRKSDSYEFFFPREKFFSSLCWTCHWKKNPLVFLRVTAGMLTLGKVPASSSFFPTMLPEVARSRIRQGCVSKRNGCSEPHLFGSPLCCCTSWNSQG